MNIKLVKPQKGSTTKTPKPEKSIPRKVKILIWDHNRDGMLERASVAKPHAAPELPGVLVFGFSGVGFCAQMGFFVSFNFNHI